MDHVNVKVLPTRRGINLILKLLKRVALLFQGKENKWYLLEGFGLPGVNV